MKIKDGQRCVRYSTPNWWMMWVHDVNPGSPYRLNHSLSDKHVLRVDAIKSKLLRSLCED